MNPLLVTMRGIPYLPSGEINLAALSDFEAGFIILDLIAKSYPGITWGQLLAMADQQPERMNGWWTDLKKTVTAPVRDLGGMIGEVSRSAGHGVMEFLRDDKVQDNIYKAYTGFADSGGVAGFWGGSSIFGQGGGGAGGGDDGGIMGWLNGFISGLGGEAKQNQAGMFGGGNALPWLIVGGFVLATIFGKRAA